MLFSTFKKKIPSRCYVCNSFCSNTVCATCYSGFKRNFRCCSLCADSLESADKATEELTAVCGRCISYPPPYDTTISPFIYTNEVRDLIQLFKFRGEIQLADFFTDLITEEFTKAPKYRLKPDVVIPIPLNSNRLKKRGFNQAQLLAKAISTKLGIPIADDIIIRNQRNVAQTGLSRHARIKNISGAFSIKPCHLPDIKHILLVDDVITTGATISEACKCLRITWPSTYISVCAIARAHSSI